MHYKRVHPFQAVTNDEIFNARYRFTKAEVHELVRMIDPYLYDDRDNSDWPIFKEDQVRNFLFLIYYVLFHPLSSCFVGSHRDYVSLH